MATTLLLLTLASFVAGAINAMAGGGTFVAFPALTGIARLSEKAANITSTVGLWPGYMASVAAARKALGGLGRNTVLLYAGIGIVGGVAGAIILLTTSSAAFAKVVPWLLAFSTALFAAAPTIHRWASRRERRERETAPTGPTGARSARSARAVGPSSPLVLAVMLVIAIYNGYFGAGGGVLMLAGMAILLPGNVRRINMLKVLIQVSANASAGIVFLFAGIHWAIAVALSVGSGLGGFLGMRVANRIPARVLHGVILAVGAMLTVAYFVKVYGLSRHASVLFDPGSIRWALT
jgi:uncharacterized membrane protein YfcA